MNKQLKHLILTIATFGTAIASPSLAQADETHAHDGFMIRLTGGVGAGAAIRDEDAIFKEITWGGLAGLFSLDIGAAVKPNLIVHGRLSNVALIDPTVKADNVSIETESTSVSMPLFGAGATYYLMPANVYFTGVIGITEFTIQEDNVEFLESDRGLGVEFDVGKEWWVSENWGVGIAGRLRYSAAEHDGTDMSGLAGGVLFSATYN